MRTSRSRRLLALLTVVAASAVFVPAASADHAYLTPQAPLLELAEGVPSGASVKAIINSGDQLGDFEFQGIPDGVGIRPGAQKHTIDVYVAHEQTTVPFFGTADFEDASVSVLTLNTKAGSRQGSVLDAGVALPASEGFLRFCSASMAGPAEGLSTYMFFTGEETGDIVDVPSDALYGSDPAVAPQRQAGYAVVIDTETGAYTHIPGMGRLNHENSIVVPGGWDDFAILTTDDTFSGPSAQLYLYLASKEADIMGDGGTLWAFRATHKNGVEVEAADPFNGANDYLDLGVGESISGEFIPVPDDIADGTTDVAPQDDLENWSNDQNVFQFIRLEDLAYDVNDPRVVYIADTGRSRVVPDPTTGRLVRGPSGTTGLGDNGRVFKMVFDADDPTQVESLTVLAQGDDPTAGAFVPFVSPDNVGVSKKSIMVQEDATDAKIWQYRFSTNEWRHVATVTDPDGESSGIVDASAYFGGGTWLLTIQAHGEEYVDQEVEDGVLYKLEAGQLLLLKIPGS